ncbi:MAG: Uma2 family endonuclease [Planctomycetes bacterium]|nr:Uma2 family endonuclease [Planctomycetota bacterium]
MSIIVPISQPSPGIPGDSREAAPVASAPRGAAACDILPPEALPDEESLVTEDDTPVDGVYSEKQMRFLTEPLYSSRPLGERIFLATANVGLFFATGKPPHVPDVLLSLDVEAPQDLWPKKNRSYFIWRYAKPPDVVIEVVSNREGGEDDFKLRSYADIGIPYYVIWDPEELLRAGVLRVFSRQPTRYRAMEKAFFPEFGLGLAIWHGEFEGIEADWLRWVDANGEVVPTGAELAQQALQLLNAERQRADRLAAQVRALGGAPE